MIEKTAVTEQCSISLRAEAAHFLFVNMTSAMLLSLMLPVPIWYAFHSMVDATILFSWIITYYIGTIPRYFIARHYSMSILPHSEELVAKWEKLLVLITLVGGVLWGAAVVFFLQLGQLNEALFLLVMINGICLLSIFIAGYNLPAFYALIIPVLGAEMLALLLQGGASNIGLTSVVALFCLLLIRMGHNSHRLNMGSLRLKFDNLDLVERLRKERNRAQVANKAKSRFLAAASHDLRQPVHSLAMFVEALRTEVQTGEARELVDHVNNSVESLDQLLTALLDISKLDAGVVSARKIPIKLQPLLRNIIEENLPLAESKNLHLHLRACDHIVYTDPILLSTVIRNLVVNAVCYTHEGGILVGCRVRKNKVVLQVWDSGIGIDQNKIEDIFLEFYQIDNKERDRQKGLGLGLSICKRLADLLGHRMTMKTRLDKGTVFNIELEKLGKDKVQQTTIEKTAVKRSLKGWRILVVDNELAVLQSMLSLLNRWGCIVHTATNEVDALGFLKESNIYDIFICDYQLGGSMNGIQLLSALRSGKGEATPGIIITGNTDPLFIKAATNAGYILLHKPVKPAQLRAVLHQNSRSSLAQANH